MTRWPALSSSLQLDKHQLHRLPEVYADEVLFIDPAHRIEGLAALIRHFSSLYERLAQCSFRDNESAAVRATKPGSPGSPTFSHPRIAGGRAVRVEGPPG